MTTRRHLAFTAVELLVAIVVGVLLLGSAYQLYSVILNNSGNTQLKAKASNVAYDLLRQYTANATKPCSNWTLTPSISSSMPNATATVVATCPLNEYGANSVLLRASSATLITVTVSYDSPNTKQVIRAISVTP
ncbi:prepilin-type N-terminal cleavage/methylation domain-containing protein [Candidatus Saccharibacteria bacterium]|nr:MAG: prepilin-type N-terminal cleavage/methylation domain-containing protein [Candidatus Saccharibacteria bacterium]